MSSSDTSSNGDTSERRRIMDGTPARTIVLRSSSRQTHLPPRYCDYVLMANVMNVTEPMNYEQAKDKEEWLNVMTEEYNSIMKNQTWELTELSENKVP